MHFLHDRRELAALLGRNPALNLYALGDLDDLYWPRTTWATDGAGEVVLVYAAPGLPVVLGFTERPAAMRALLRELAPFLPGRFYAHLSPGLADALPEHAREPHGTYRRMVLTDRSALERVDTGACEPVGPAQLAEAQAFYAVAYPGNWFDPRMLETDRYFGIRRNGSLVAIAGVHVFSPAYRVAALGNICVHPDARGGGLGAAVTARTCRALLADADVIGLNVHGENRAAIRVYEKLGFATVAEFEELMCVAHSAAANGGTDARSKSSSSSKNEP